jgi:hypothetical protein
MSQKHFIIKVECEITLGVDEIWVDGDAPENPTAKDVVKLMQDDCCTVTALLSEWNFPTSVHVQDQADWKDEETWDDNP